MRISGQYNPLGIGFVASFIEMQVCLLNRNSAIRTMKKLI